MQYKMEDVAEAIQGSGGVVSTVASHLGCTWHTARRCIDRWEHTRELAKDEEEAVIDMAESIVIGSINKGDVSMAKWMLATKGRRRGYGDKQEVDPAEQAAIFREIMKGFIGEG